MRLCCAVIKKDVTGGVCTRAAILLDGRCQGELQEIMPNEARARGRRNGRHKNEQKGGTTRDKKKGKAQGRQVECVCIARKRDERTGNGVYVYDWDGSSAEDWRGGMAETKHIHGGLGVARG